MAAGVVEITEQSFEQDVVQSGKPALVDFWAVWCGPCRMIGPIVEELATEYGDQMTIGKVNVDDHASLASTNKVMNIPTIVFFKGGQEVDRVVGVAPKQELVKKCESLLQSA
jgi:thioredoxin 1